MADTSVTHEQLRAGQMALIDRFSQHEKHFHETTTRIFDKLDLAIDASHENKLALTKLDGQMMGMQEGRDGHLARLVTAETAIKTLEATNNRHEGERGVWAALARSPLAAWLAAAALVVWNFLSHGGAAKL